MFLTPPQRLRKRGLIPGRRRIALVGFPWNSPPPPYSFTPAWRRARVPKLDRTVFVSDVAVNSWVEEQGYTAARAM